MLTLHQFESAFGVPNASPFCLKLECFLRMAGVPYRAEPLRDLAEAPKRKGPFVTDEDGSRIGDSALIIAHLKRTRGIDLDGWLSPAERAAALALRVMLEEHLYFAILHNRWIEDAHWPLVRDAYLGDLPAPVQDGIRAHVRGRVEAQGLGVHTPEEIYALAVPELRAVADWLGGKPFLMGDRPAEVDCTAFAFVANLLMPSVFHGPLQDEARRHPNLAAHGRRMLERFFPEWADAQAA